MSIVCLDIIVDIDVNVAVDAEDMLSKYVNYVDARYWVEVL